MSSEMPLRQTLLFRDSYIARTLERGIYYEYYVMH